MIAFLPLRFLFLFTSTIGRGTLLLLVVALAAFALRRASAAVRHLVWALGLVSLTALFLLADRIPSISAPIPQKITAAFVRFPTGDESLSETLRRQTRLNQAARVWGRDIPVASVPSIAIDPLTISQEPFLAISNRLSPIPMILMLVWLAGVIITLARTVMGLRMLSRIRSASVEVKEGRLAELLSESADAVGYKRDVYLALAEKEYSGLPPMTWGFRKPTVLLPTDAPEWPEDRIRAAILHEMGHVKRGDFVWQMAAAVSCALFWFHPLVWWATEQMRVESEKACDDYVLNCGTRPTEYAGLLLDVARSLRCTASPVAVALTMVRRPRIEGRLRAVLNNRITRHPVTRRALSAVVIISSIIILPLAAFQPVLRVLPSSPIVWPKGNIVTAVDNLVRLDNGVTLELVGISDNGLRRQTWWKPSGDSLSEAPYPLEGVRCQ